MVRRVQPEIEAWFGGSEVRSSRVELGRREERVEFLADEREIRVSPFRCTSKDNLSDFV